MLVFPITYGSVDDEDKLKRIHKTYESAVRWTFDEANKAADEYTADNQGPSFGVHTNSGAGTLDGVYNMSVFNYAMGTDRPDFWWTITAMEVED